MPFFSFRKSYAYCPFQLLKGSALSRKVFFIIENCRDMFDRRMVIVHNPYDFILVNSSYKSILEHPSVQTSYDYFSVDVPFGVDSQSLINRTIKLHLVSRHHTTTSRVATFSYFSHIVIYGIFLYLIQPTLCF